MPQFSLARNRGAIVKKVAYDGESHRTGRAVVDADQTFKTVALTDVNTHIREVACESISEEQEWEFFCECGEPDCRAQVMLTLERYSMLHDHRQAVLAPGHVLSQVERARRLATEAEALRRQARHQLERAQTNLGAPTG
jgi:hypothetical protein